MANSLLISLAVLLALFGASRATDFEVGGDAGWVVPPAGQASTYNDWASKNRFLLGDSVRKNSTDAFASCWFESICGAIVRAHWFMDVLCDLKCM